MIGHDAGADLVILDPLHRVNAGPNAHGRQPLEIARRADVHGVGDGGDDLTGLVDPALRPVAKRAVGIGD
jgi:hypothetical protein